MVGLVGRRFLAGLQALGIVRLAPLLGMRFLVELEVTAFPLRDAVDRVLGDEFGELLFVGPDGLVEQSPRKRGILNDYGVKLDRF